MWERDDPHSNASYHAHDFWNIFRDHLMSSGSVPQLEVSRLQSNSLDRAEMSSWVFQLDHWRPQFPGHALSRYSILMMVVVMITVRFHPVSPTQGTDQEQNIWFFSGLCFIWAEYRNFCSQSNSRQRWCQSSATHWGASVLNRTL